MLEVCEYTLKCCSCSLYPVRIKTLLAHSIEELRNELQDKREEREKRETLPVLVRPSRLDIQSHWSGLSHFWYTSISDNTTGASATYFRQHRIKI